MHRSSKRGLAAACTGILALSVLAVPATAVDGVTRYVSATGAGPAGCAGTPYITIQSAVTASGPGDTVLVCPGTYQEAVLITGARNGLTLRATSPWKATVVSPASYAGKAVIIDVEAVNGVHIQWLRIVARTRGVCARTDAAVLLTDSRHSVVRSNRILPSGADTLGSCGYSDGISMQGTSSATALFNYVRDFQLNGIVGGDQSTLWAIRNSVRYRHAHARVRDRIGTPRGIVVGGQGKIQRNGVVGLASADHTTPAVYVAILVNTRAKPGVKVLHNYVRYGRYGVSSYADGSIWRYNTVRDFTYTAFEIVANNVEEGPGNRATGSQIGIYSGATGAFIHGNNYLGNSDWDCFDDGLSNTWTNNLGATANPGDICSPTRLVSAH